MKLCFPAIDGKVDDIWATTPRLIADRLVEAASQVPEGESPARAAVRCLWDDGHLYCLAEVKDSKISMVDGEDRECDSVEFFIDENDARANSDDSDDAQYRTNAEGANTSGYHNDLENYKSAISKTEDGCIVEACIKLETSVGKKIGFDAQVNDDTGFRTAIMKWNDSTNDTSQDISGVGTLQMVGEN